MRAFVDRLLAQWMPASANRTLWKMTVGVYLALGLTGPIWGSSIVAELTDATYVSLLPFGFFSNIIAVIAAALVMGWLMRRWTHRRLDPSRQVLAVVTSGLVGIVARFLAVWTFRYGYPELGPKMALTNMAIATSVIVTTSIVVLYAARREYDLEASYADALAHQAALIREEEDVRARIFDDLHGTAQARIHETRHRVRTMAATVDDLEVQQQLQGLDQDLLHFYDSHIGRLARALFPAGLEVSLRAAVEELRERNAGTIEIDLDMDLVASTLDDPMSGGLHRDLRIALYRVIEECTLNAIRHAGAPRIAVHVTSTMDHGQTHLVVTATNSCRQEPVARFGHGLTRMRQRVNVLGGTMSLELEPDAFTVRVEIPTAKISDRT